MSFRYRIMELVLALATALASETQRILRFVHHDLLGVLSKKNVALMRELNFVCRCPDFAAVLDLVWGLPMAGWARHCPNLVQKLSSLPKPFDAVLDDVSVDRFVDKMIEAGIITTEKGEKDVLQESFST